MKIKFYGVRGSHPVPGNTTVRYGGNTSCVTVYKVIENNKILRIIIDSGSGIVKLGKEIMQNWENEIKPLTILFTHLHPDHTAEFPFFAPNYREDAVINMYGMQALKMHVGKVIERNMIPPNFPIEYKDLKSRRNHYVIKDNSKFKLSYNGRDYFEINAMQSFAPSHPQQGAIYYKIIDLENGSSLSCIWDIESKIGGDKAVINFAKDSDVMIHDTQYTEEEYISSKFIVQGFGHSTYEMAIENANQANIKKYLICTHFNTTHSDEKLDQIQKDLNKRNFKFKVILAYEGLEIEL
ncbi:MAG: MBL fold metallo-hydrolase [Spirochaetes bacterium]|nr:MBL fold metallo-hydrolase [Spirochaetota bacterium]